MPPDKTNEVNADKKRRADNNVLDKEANTHSEREDAVPPTRQTRLPGMPWTLGRKPMLRRRSPYLPTG